MARKDRLKDLQQATNDYVKNETNRLTNEVQVLQSILNGRTAGAGIQAINVKVVQGAAEADLAEYLKGP